MKSSVLESFFLGVTFGVGMTLLFLYTQKPGPLATSVQTIAERGWARKRKGEENRFRRERLKAMGFTNAEIEEIL